MYRNAISLQTLSFKNKKKLEYGTVSYHFTANGNGIERTHTPEFALYINLYLNPGGVKSGFILGPPFHRFPFSGFRDFR